MDSPMRIVRDADDATPSSVSKHHGADRRTRADLTVS